MQDYLKKHATQAAYTTWAASNDYVTPNVSLIEADGSLSYTPPVIGIPLQSITISGNQYWNDHYMEITYTVSLTPANTTQTGITWSLSESHGDVQIISQSNTECTLKSQQYDGSFNLIATSTDNPLISTSYAITRGS